MNDRVRFTIAVDSEVHDAFATLADTTGVSLSRCIGDWLRDTSEAAQMVTLKVRDARRSPAEAFQIFMRDGMVPEMNRLREAGLGASLVGQKRSIPPSSNTGGKSPGKTRKSS